MDLDNVFYSTINSFTFTVTGTERGDDRLNNLPEKKLEKIQTCKVAAKQLDVMGNILLNNIQEDIAWDLQKFRYSASQTPSRQMQIKGKFDPFVHVMETMCW